MNTLRWAIGLSIVVALTACADWAKLPGDVPAVSLPMQRAWVDGRVVDYVSTDTSDAGMARDMGLNYVPRLGALLPAATAPSPGARSALERVYMFVGREQLNVFGSAPRPAGAGNADNAYSPLWRVVEVRWLAGSTPRPLTAEEAVLAAADRGDVTLRVTDVVVNCPIVRAADGSALRGLR